MLTTTSNTAAKVYLVGDSVVENGQRLYLLERGDKYHKNGAKKGFGKCVTRDRLILVDREDSGILGLHS